MSENDMRRAVEEILIDNGMDSDLATITVDAMSISEIQSYLQEVSCEEIV